MTRLNTAHGRMDSLQVLRAFAASAVVLFHCDWTGIASFGVELFFVLSGFIICYAAARDPDQFFLKRAIRVVPLYWAATLSIICGAIMLPQLFPGSVVTTETIVKSLFFIPFARADGEVYPLLFLGWTLNYEMFFYLIFGLSLTISKHKAPVLAAIIIMILVALHPILKTLGVALDFWTKPILLYFVVGIAAYGLWLKRGYWTQRLSPKVAMVASAMTFTLFVIDAPSWFAAHLVIKGFLAVVLLLMLVRLDGFVTWPAWILLLGDASYSLYLLHPYAIEAIDRLVYPLSSAWMGVTLTLVACALAGALAVIGYKAVEAPSNRYLRRWLGQGVKI
jgi:exopolysaccharide production protein ExoZ